MKKYLISYASPEFYESQKRLNDSAVKFGIDEFRAFNNNWLKKTEFYKNNKHILDLKRGSGYWLWKPFIILDFINQIEEGDLLIYADSGIEVISDLSPLINLCIQQNGILLFKVHGGHPNRKWTKRDCFALMNCDSEDYWNSEQINASFQLYIKNDASIKFLQDYLYYCQQINILTDIPNITRLENHPEFVDHRHDQSVLSLLALKYKIETFRDPCQWGNHLKMKDFRTPNDWLSLPYSDSPCLNSPYPTVLNHHRERKITLLGRIKNKIEKITKN